MVSFPMILRQKILFSTKELLLIYLSENSIINIRIILAFPIIKFYDLRYSIATFLMSLGFNLKVISVWLGQADIGTTMNIYSHIGIEDKRNIANELNKHYEAFNG